MHTLLESSKMPDEKRELMTEEKTLSRFIRDEMTQKEKLLGEILDQTKLVKKRLDNYEKQIEMDNKEPALKKKDIAEIKEGLASTKDIVQKQLEETQYIKKEITETKKSLKQYDSRFKQLEKSLQRKGTDIVKIEDDLKSANTEISSLKAFGDQFASLKTEQIEITEENDKMKKELLEWQKVLESEHQQQKRCLRCKSAARRKFRDHSSE